MPVTIKTWVPADGAWDSSNREPGRRVIVTQSDGRVTRCYATANVQDGTLSDTELTAIRSSELFGAPVETDAEISARSAKVTANARRATVVNRNIARVRASADAVLAVAPGSRTPAQRLSLARDSLLLMLVDSFTDDGEP